MSNIHVIKPTTKHICIEVSDVAGKHGSATIALALYELSDEQVQYVFSQLDNGLRTLMAHIDIEASEKEK